MLSGVTQVLHLQAGVDAFARPGYACGDLLTHRRYSMT
jgi:hypothetical protein